jgi:integrase
MNIKDHARRKPRVHSWATLSNEQISKILSLSERDQLVHDIRDVVLIATGTGIRAGELRDLQWTDVDLSRRELTIRSNSGSIRKVPLGDETLGVFEARRARQPELELVLGVSPRRVIERVSRKLAVLSKSIGIGSISMYLLRRTFAARLVNSGANIWSVMGIMGWSMPRSITHGQHSAPGPLVHVAGGIPSDQRNQRIGEKLY